MDIYRGFAMNADFEGVGGVFGANMEKRGILRGFGRVRGVREG